MKPSRWWLSVESDKLSLVLRPQTIERGVSVFPVLTPTLPPATHTNCYALGEREVLLVEPATPYPDEQRAFIEWARGLQSQGRELKALLVTHHHPDHVGGVDALSEALGLPVWLHPETSARLAPHHSPWKYINDGDQITLAGPKAQRWRVLHTPGHAPGHICLHEPELKQLVVGDMVASVGTILIAPGDGHMGTYLAQLGRLISLNAERALPAHGAPISEPNAWFEHYIKHRAQREQTIVNSLRKYNGASASELLPHAYSDAPREIWPLAKLSLDAHLIKLVEEGRVTERDQRFYIAAEP